MGRWADLLKYCRKYERFLYCFKLKFEEKNGGGGFLDFIFILFKKKEVIY